MRSSRVLSMYSIRRNPPLSVNHTPHSGKAMTRNSSSSFNEDLSMSYSVTYGDRCRQTRGGQKAALPASGLLEVCVEVRLGKK